MTGQPQMAAAAAAAVAPGGAGGARSRWRVGTRTSLLFAGFAMFLLLLPLVVRGDTGRSTLCFIGVMVVYALSFNVLLGQAGLLSLGHGMFFGLGGFATVHAINVLSAAELPVPLPALPLVGGLGGLVFGALFGMVATRRDGMAFAMITLGLGELVSGAATLLPSVFGGEQGVGTDRTSLGPFLGIGFARQGEVYYLIAGWCFVTVVVLYGLTRTPFGLISRSLRENPGRVEFLGYRPQTIRFLAFCTAAFFAGLAGALAAVNFEIMTTGSIGAVQSTIVLLMTYIGGVGFFVGPMIGAALISVMQIWLSDITPAWQMYFGLMFIAVVMFIPGGLAGMLFAAARAAMTGALFRSLPRLLAALAASLIAAVGLSVLIELVYQAGLNASQGPVRWYFGLPLRTDAPWFWLAGVVLLIAGAAALRVAGPALTQRLRSPAPAHGTGGLA